jgi:hypothetical protein
MASSSLERVARIGRPMSIADDAATRVAGLAKLVAAGQANGTYTPIAPGNWAGAAPATVQQALDRIASAVRTLLGAPIP